jgi:hypothetical protein
MRSHRFPSFPDASANSIGNRRPSNTIDGIVIPSSIDVQSPVFQAAVRACQQVLSGGPPPPPITEKQREAALAVAACIRRHGFPNFPDPVFTKNEIGVRTGGTDTQSPTFLRAGAACRTP